jgi:hypothetical protein
MHKIIVTAAALCLVGGSVLFAGDKQPAWVLNPRSVYSDAQYVSAVGSGASREAAEKKAVSELVAVFGQSVKGETAISSRYSEAVKNGVVVASDDTSVNEAVSTSVSFDTIVGAEIKDVWFDGKKTTWAVAVMDKAKAGILYAGLIDKDEAAIAKLTDIPEADRASFDAYSRFDLAAAIADADATFLNILSVVSPGTAATKRESVKSADALRLECVKIAQSLPIALIIDGDRDARVRSAFASSFSDAGFKTVDHGARYALTAKITLSEAKLADNPNKFVRYVLEANLTDMKTGAVILPFSANGREGHATVAEAENRAYRAAEKKIREDFLKAFRGYLTQLSSK